MYHYIASGYKSSLNWDHFFWGGEESAWYNLCVRQAPFACHQGAVMSLLSHGRCRTLTVLHRVCLATGHTATCIVHSSEKCWASTPSAASQASFTSSLPFLLLVEIFSLVTVPLLVGRHWHLLQWDLFRGSPPLKQIGTFCPGTHNHSDFSLSMQHAQAHLNALWVGWKCGSSAEPRDPSMQLPGLEAFAAAQTCLRRATAVIFSILWGLVRDVFFLCRFYSCIKAGFQTWAWLGFNGLATWPGHWLHTVLPRNRLAEQGYKVL